MYNIIKAAGNVLNRWDESSGVPLLERYKYAVTPARLTEQKQQDVAQEYGQVAPDYNYDISGNVMNAPASPNPAEYMAPQEQAPMTMSSSETGSGGGSGSGSGTPEFQPTPYMGQIYYTAEEYANAVNQHIDEIYNQSLRTIENNFKNGFITIDQKDAEIKRTRGNLVKKRDNDLQSVSGYFNAISPDAQQSQQGTYAKKAVEDYTTNNQMLGTELGSNLYDANGNIRQDLQASDLAPYMTQNSDTGNLARAISSNYQGRDTNVASARDNAASNIQSNAENYIGNMPAGSDYSNYLNSNILNNPLAQGSPVGPAIVKKTDKYGNPIDEWANQ